MNSLFSRLCRFVETLLPNCSRNAFIRALIGLTLTGPKSHRWLLVLFVGAVIAAAGCGNSGRPPLGSVHGGVTLDGKPLPKAQVAFVPDKGRVATGITDDEGHYDLIYLSNIKGTMVGKNKVQVRTVYSEEGTREILPQRYNDKTTLEYDVSSGDQSYDIELVSK